MQVFGGRVVANSNPKEEARPRRSQATQSQGRARVASMAPKGSSNNGSSPREGAKVEPRAKAKAKEKGRKVKAMETMAIGSVRRSTCMGRALLQGLSQQDLGRVLLFDRCPMQVYCATARTLRPATAGEIPWPLQWLADGRHKKHIW